MSEIEVLDKIAACLEGIKSGLVGVGCTLWLMLLFKNMGGK